MTQKTERAFQSFSFFRPMPSTPTIDRKKDGRILCTVTYSTEEVTDFQGQTLQRFAANIEVPGFRKGHAPIEKVRERVKDDALDEEMIRTMVGTLIPVLVRENDLKPMIPPNVAVTSRSPLTLQVTIVERPVAKIKNMKKLKIAKKDIVVDTKERDKVIASILNEQRTATPVDRPVQKDDRVTADFSAVDAAGKDIPGLKSVGYQILVGSESLLPGFEEQLIGMKKSEPKNFTLTLPEKFPAPELQGKPVTFTVSLSVIEETKLPSLTDAFAKEHLQSESVEAFKKMVEDSMKMQEKQMEDMRRERELMDAIRDQTEATLPPELIEEELKHLISEWSEDLAKQGTTIVDQLKRQGKTVEKAEEELRARATDRWKLRLGISALMEERKIEVTDKEITDALGGEEGDREEVRWKLLVQKLIDGLLAE